MTNFGITEKELTQIQKIISEYPEIQTSCIFGSRAMGNYKNTSDIDIAIGGEKVSFHTVSKVHGRLEEEVSTPLFFDVISLQSLENKELQEHVKTYGKSIFS